MLAALVGGLFVVGPAQARHLPGCNSRRCDRVAVHACQSHRACARRVARKRDAREWAYYRAHPMPYCTWGPESGGNYRAMNPTSTAGGKYQMLNQTFHGYGGPNYGTGHDAAVAPPLVQERVARRVLQGQGLGAWVNC